MPCGPALTAWQLPLVITRPPQPIRMEEPQTGTDTAEPGVLLCCVQLAAARAESKDNRSKYLEELTKHNADLVLLEAAEAHTSELEKQLQAAQVSTLSPPCLAQAATALLLCLRCLLDICSALFQL